MTETATGATTEVEVAASDPVTVEVLPAGTVDAEFVNTATFAPGALRVVKTVAGVAAGQQGEIVLDIDCGDALSTTFTIAAGSAAGDYEQTFTELPADTECTVTETQTGASGDIIVTGDDPVTVVVPAGARPSRRSSTMCATRASPRRAARCRWPSSWPVAERRGSAAGSSGSRGAAASRRCGDSEGRVGSTAESCPRAAQGGPGRNTRGDGSVLDLTCTARCIRADRCRGGVDSAPPAQ